jgi:GNAT superfamily N-acetyltransferase
VSARYKAAHVDPCIGQGISLNTEFSSGNILTILRPVDIGDQDFLLRLYASTRADEMALVDWSAEQKAAFLLIQLQAQTAHYRTYYPHAEYLIIQHDDSMPLGRLIVDRASDSMLIVDIALLPEYRGAGIGTTIIQQLMAEAARAKFPIILRVELFNPAVRLYSRLGFVKTRAITMYHEMIWQPGSSPA